MSEELLENILIELRAMHITLRGFIAKTEALQPDLEYREEKEEPQVIVTQKSGKYDWIVLADGSKIRKCNNKPCPYYLRYNGTTYEHGKYDANENTWSFVAIGCEFFNKGGK